VGHGLACFDLFGGVWAGLVWQTMSLVELLLAAKWSCSGPHLGGGEFMGLVWLTMSVVDLKLASRGLCSGIHLLGGVWVGFG
jgi:hypothetical protein